MRDKITADRVSKLHPKVRDEAAKAIDNAELGFPPNMAMRVVQGLRTIAEQNALYAKGRTSPGPIVTKAKGGSSYHNYGLAIDLVTAGTFKGQREDYIRYQLSYGGPSEEFRIYKNGDVEFWLLDWFDGAKVDVTSEDADIIKNIVKK